MDDVKPEPAPTARSGPMRIQLRRSKGWRKPAGAIVVARPSRWGNPFRVQRSAEGHLVTGPGIDEPPTFGSHREAVADSVRRHRPWLEAEIEAGRVDLSPLADHDLACWCPPQQACHADTLLDLAGRRGSPRGESSS
jgi:hypothetical protein